MQLCVFYMTVLIEGCLEFTFECSCVFLTAHHLRIWPLQADIYKVQTHAHRKIQFFMKKVSDEERKFVEGVRSGKCDIL